MAGVAVVLGGALVLGIAYRMGRAMGRILLTLLGLAAIVALGWVLLAQ